MSRIASAAFAFLFTSAFSSTVRAAAPTVDECITANESGISQRASGKLHDGLASFAACAVPACPKDVRLDCEKHLEEVKAAMPTVIFEPKDGAGNDLPSVALALDGTPLNKTLDGTPLQFDPGAHLFTFTAPGKPPVSVSYLLHEGDKGRHERITLGAPPPAATPPPSVPVGKDAALPGPAPTHSSLRTTTLAGLIAGGVGVVGVGIGSVFGLMTGSAASAQKAACSSANSCPDYARAASEHASMVTDGNISTIAFIAGGVLVAGGVTLLLIPAGHTDQTPTATLHFVPTAGPGGGGMLLRGEF